MEKITKVILGCCLLGWGNHLYAQSVTLTGGGNATGSGGSASYSIGQTFFLVNSSSSNILSEGVQQSRESLQTLPVTWLSFEAKKVNDFVELKWSTASEVNNKVFIIERSTDGENFTKLVEISPADGNLNVNTYDYTDKFPVTGHSYYRLKQVDQDGEFSYSEIRVMQFNLLVNRLLEVYPNPLVDILKIDLFSEKDKEETLFFYDLNGRRVATKVCSIKKGTNNLIWDLSFLSSGTYILKTSEESISSSKIIKQ